MNLFPRRLLRWALCAAVAAGAASAPAQTAAPPTADAPKAPAAAATAAGPAANGGYTAKGADTCLGCHDDESAAYSASALFKTAHARRGDRRSPFGPGGLQCEACHGPGAAHARNKKAESINTFKRDAGVPPAERDRACLTCHESSTRTAWHTSAHQRADVGCTDCHRVHREHDPVLKKASEPAVCLTCHRAQKADFAKTSAHPVGAGRMACTDCHAAHGADSPGALVRPTLNQTCTDCHAAQRGPVLWEHQPVAEDCSACHRPHGSVRRALLTQSPPLLCQQCHNPSGHPAVPRTGAALPGAGGAGAMFLVGGSCTNCHTQVHGSNHPSGARLMR